MLPRITDLGARVVAVGTGAGWQAERLMAGDATSEPIGFECLVYPDRNLYRALDLGRVPWRHWLSLELWRNYLGAFRRGGRQGAVTGDWRQLSGVAIVTSDPRSAHGRVTYLHRSRTVGDYPSISSMLGHLGDAR